MILYRGNVSFQCYRPCQWLGRCFLAVTLCVLLAGCGGPSGITEEIVTPPAVELPPRPVDYTLTLPSPLGMPTDRLPNFRDLSVADSIIPVVFYIDSSGYTDTVTLLEPDDSLALQLRLDSLKGVRFEPGLSDAQPVAIRLPALLQVLRGQTKPILIFPVDDSHVIRDTALYMQALKCNGVSPALLNSFPSYFAVVNRQPRRSQAPCVIAKVVIDTTGRPTRIEPLVSTLPEFTQEVLSAMNWAEYLPARIHDSLFVDSGRVAVFLYPELTYPVPPLNADSTDSLDVLHRTRVSFVPWDFSRLRGPVPRNLTDGCLVARQPIDLKNITVRALISVDTLGRVWVLDTGTRSRETSRKFEVIIRQIDFYPAVAVTGQSLLFRGWVRLGFDGSRRIRIQCEWLNPSGFSDIR